jgi:hypothetical protein
MTNSRSQRRASPNPWISSSGEIAHPDSPRGSGGPGGFTSALPLGVQGSGSCVLAHPQSPAGRTTFVGDAQRILLAKSAALAKQPAAGTSDLAHTRRVVVFTEFNNKGKGKYVEAVKSNPMGVHPRGNFPFVNAVELVFKVDEELAKKMGIRAFRCRQQSYTQEIWEREIQNGQFTPWKKTISGGEGSDDPDPGLQQTTPPILAFHDAPGFYATAKDAQLSGPAPNQKTSKTAVAVFLRQNFTAWIDGLRVYGQRGVWEQVSDGVKWHSHQNLVADILGLANVRWIAAAQGCEIELGHTQGQPK